MIVSIMYNCFQYVLVMEENDGKIQLLQIQTHNLVLLNVFFIIFIFIIKLFYYIFSLLFFFLNSNIMIIETIFSNFLNIIVIKIF